MKKGDVYVGRCEHGAVMGLVMVSGDSGSFVKDMIDCGLVIDRVSWAEYETEREQPSFFNCKQCLCG